MNEKEIIYKIRHKPTGLFYCSRKGGSRIEKTNLSEKGNFYTSEKQALKVLAEDVKRADINKAQTERYNLPIICEDRWSYNEAVVEDFEIVKYSLEEIK